jgi:methylglutaconyl-CoA hydratase
MSEFTNILVGQSDAVTTVTLNRPSIHNAFDEALISELKACFEALSTDDSVRIIVLTGAGKSFCAGADLDWMKRVAKYGWKENLADAHGLHRLLEAIYECPKATIARVNGAAIGGGAGLVAACDIAVASEDAKFAFSEVRLGIAPAVISPFVVQKIGIGAARAKFVTGERFSVKEALGIGFIDQIVPAAELDSAIKQLTESLLKCGPHAIAATKALLRNIAGKSPAECAEITAETIATLRTSAEGQEGIRAFLEKRKPDFAG